MNRGVPGERGGSLGSIGCEHEMPAPDELVKAHRERREAIFGSDLADGSR
jgi:hypothetical protein